MNRRQFTTGLTAVAAAPALPLKAALPAAAPSVAVPNAARFWAIYMSHLHGTVSAKSIATMTGIGQAEAQRHLTTLLADGVIRPHNVFAQASKVIRTSDKAQPRSWREKLENYLFDDDSQEPENEQKQVTHTEPETTEEKSDEP